MFVELHQVTSALYLAAGLVAGVGLELPAPRLVRVGVALLALGALVHGLAFLALHAAAQPPPLTDLPAAVSLAAWIAVVFFLTFLRRARLAGLVVVLGPVAFVGAFYAALRLPHSERAPFVGSASWPHAHVLLGSAGLALFGLAGLAGLFFLVVNRSLKRKRPGGASRALPLPSLEALDRVNAVAFAAGFPLLTLGLVTGFIWMQHESGRLWTGTAHETWTAVAWSIYAALAALRFVRHQRGREAALASLAGFAFLLFAVVGVGLLS